MDADIFNGHKKAQKTQNIFTAEDAEGAEVNKGHKIVLTQIYTGGN